MKTYMVKSTFGPTIQGEGTYAGTVVKFLRFAGCNKWSGKEEDRAKSVCWYCDTDFRGGDKVTADQIVERLNALGACRRVVISGGEPSLQVDKELLEKLIAADYEIHMETNGSKDIGDLAGMFTHITCSPKQPRDQTKLKYAHDFKLLWPPPLPEMTMASFYTFNADSFYLQPLWTEKYDVNLKDAVKTVLENPEWKISVQTHKIIGVE